MPIYEYSCRECGAEFEKFIGGPATIACPSCQSERVMRLMSLVGVKSSGRFVSPSSSSMQGGCCGGGCGCH
jgi:putative FmdB family regulatory protein